MYGVALLGLLDGGGREGWGEDREALLGASGRHTSQKLCVGGSVGIPGHAALTVVSSTSLCTSPVLAGGPPAQASRCSLAARMSRTQSCGFLAPA